MKMKKILKISYICIFFGFLVFMGVASFLGKGRAADREMSEKPEYTGYSTWSREFDDYFSLNFAYRQELIQADGILKQGILKYTSERNVVTGEDGWMFYCDDIYDYNGENRMSDEQISYIADVIEQMSEEVKAQGGDFIFTVAPNKMEVYGEYVPYFIRERDGDGNYEKLMKELERRNVKCVDMKKLLSEDDTFGDMSLYYKTDSHWNIPGAFVAYRAVMEKAGLEYTDYTKLPLITGHNYSGDLYEMYYPAGVGNDIHYEFAKEEGFIYTSNFRNGMDLLITTENENGRGKVMLFRDSFGMAWYSFFAEDFNEAYITRAFPYDVSDIEGADLVVVEIVERHIDRLLTLEKK